MTEAGGPGAQEGDGAATGRPLRLVFVSHSFPPPEAPERSVGGMQRVAVDLAAALDRRPDVALDVWAPPIPFDRATRQTTRLILEATAGLPARARRHRADAVLFSAMVTAPIAPALRPRMRRVALTAIAHGRDVTLPVAIHQLWLRPAFWSLDAVLSVSRATAAACEARGLAPSRSVVCPNGVDPDAIAPPSDRAAARAALYDRLGIPGEAAVVLAVGRQVARKGSAWFASEVLPRLPSHAHFVVVGEGPEHKAISRAAAEAGVGERVHQLGLVDDATLAAARHSADVFVMPNRPVPGDLEGFGVVALEAALSGLYTVAAGIEGICDAVVEPESGRLVPSGDADAWTDVLGRFLADPEAGRAAGAGARDHVLGRFTWDRVVACHLGHIRAAVARRTGDPSWLSPDAPPEVG